MGSLLVSGRKLLYHQYHLLWLAIDVLLPPVCAGCGVAGTRWCRTCRASITPPHPPLCRTCGTPVQVREAVCSNCRDAPPRFRQLRSLSVFEGPMRRALHDLKYRRNLGFSEALTPQLANFTDSLAWNADLIVPVPLGRRRQNERGYNQAGLIGWPLSLALGLAFVPGGLNRTRETRTQVGLTRRERRQNVEDAFQASHALVGGCRVLLVDDVATTGATLSSCAEALYAAGAQDVFALAVARAHRGPSQAA